MNPWTYRDYKGRVCTKCKTYKLWEEFNNQASGVNGHRPDCRICQRALERTYKRDPAKMRTNTNRYQAKKRDEQS